MFKVKLLKIKKVLDLMGFKNKVFIYADSILAYIFPLYMFRIVKLLRFLSESVAIS